VDSEPGERRPLHRRLRQRGGPHSDGTSFKPYCIRTVVCCTVLYYAVLHSTVLCSFVPQARFPFLDEDVVQLLMDLPLPCVVDLTLEAGVGDKKILRRGTNSTVLCCHVYYCIVL